ncbi:MAG: PAS domain S-box protein [Bryobacteraceae bacterium]
MLTGARMGADTGQAPAELRARVAELEATVEALEGRTSALQQILLDHSVPVIIYAAATLDVLEANDSAAALYGIDRGKAGSLNLLDLLMPGGRSAAELAADLKKPVNVIGPLRQRAIGGREVVATMMLFSFEVKGADARIAMIYDETERNRAETALRASEERFRDLFENANDFIFVHDLKGELLAVNRAGEQLTGYGRQELVGEAFGALVPADAQNRARDNIRAHLGGSPTQHYELPVLPRAGSLRHLEVSTRTMYSRGNPIAIQGIARDITERKLAQQRLLEQAEELRRKNRELSTALRLAREATQLKEQFLANTSHELRTPMNGIMGMVNLLRASDLTVDQREYADSISDCADDLLTIINDLLDLSQIEAGRFSLNDEPFNLRESVRSVLRLLSVRAAAKGVGLEHHVSDSLPGFIYGDCVRFRQIVTNLAANAIKFTLQGSVHVRLSVPPGGAGLRCEVVDSGIGVSEAARGRIFEAFFQADGTARRRFGGTGLGLTISKQLVEIMGGSIGMFNNDPDPGATFWFELPLRAADGAEARADCDAALPETV